VANIVATQIQEKNMLFKFTLEKKIQQYHNYIHERIMTFDLEGVKIAKVIILNPNPIFTCQM